MGKLEADGPIFDPQMALAGGLSLLSLIFVVGVKQEGLVPPWDLGLVLVTLVPSLCSFAAILGIDPLISF